MLKPTIDTKNPRSPGASGIFLWIGKSSKPAKEEAIQNPFIIFEIASAFTMLQKQINLYDIPFETLFTKVKGNFQDYHYDFKKHLLTIENETHESIGYIRLPLHIIIDEQLNIAKKDSLTVYLSIESGNAAICVTQGKDIIYHTTFSSYMTRKKQGVSQIKYLNKKGKSRAGSRVRLASTIQFFENINTTLSDLFDNHDVDRIALNCSPALIPYLHQSKVKCPFEKKDDRLYKIPLHIQQSNYTNLNSCIKKLMAPILFYDEQYEKDIKVITENV